MYNFLYFFEENKKMSNQVQSEQQISNFENQRPKVNLLIQSQNSDQTHQTIMQNISRISISSPTQKKHHNNSRSIGMSAINLIERIVKQNQDLIYSNVDLKNENESLKQQNQLLKQQKKGIIYQFQEQQKLFRQQQKLHSAQKKDFQDLKLKMINFEYEKKMIIQFKEQLNKQKEYIQHLESQNSRLKYCYGKVLESQSFRLQQRQKKQSENESASYDALSKYHISLTPPVRQTQSSKDFYKSSEQEMSHQLQHIQ